MGSREIESVRAWHSVSFHLRDESRHLALPFDEAVQPFFKIGHELTRSIAFTVQSQTPHSPGQHFLLHRKLALQFATRLVDGTLPRKLAEAVGASGNKVQQV